MSQINLGLQSNALAQQLMQLHAMLPELTSRVLETQQVRDEALSEIGFKQMIGSGKEAGHRASLSAIIRGRQARAQFMPESWFSDPAWDILLHLYQAHLDAVAQTVGDLGNFANTSPATTNRWLDVLSSRGWVDRRRCDRDQRRVFVALSDVGVEIMESYFDYLRQPAS
jgi:DNA-binding MarR family transcriptional regulator